MMHALAVIGCQYNLILLGPFLWKVCTVHNVSPPPLFLNNVIRCTCHRLQQLCTCLHCPVASWSKSPGGKQSGNFTISMNSSVSGEKISKWIVCDKVCRSLSMWGKFTQAYNLCTGALSTFTLELLCCCLHMHFPHIVNCSCYYFFTYRFEKDGIILYWNVHRKWNFGSVAMNFSWILFCYRNYLYIFLRWEPRRNYKPCSQIGECLIYSIMKTTVLCCLNTGDRWDFFSFFLFSLKVLGICYIRSKIPINPVTNECGT